MDPLAKEKRPFHSDWYLLPLSFLLFEEGKMMKPQIKISTLCIFSCGTFCVDMRRIQVPFISFLVFPLLFLFIRLVKFILWFHGSWGYQGEYLVSSLANSGIDRIPLCLWILNLFQVIYRHLFLNFIPILVIAFAYHVMNQAVGIDFLPFSSLMIIVWWVVEGFFMKIWDLMAVNKILQLFCAT